MKVLAVAAHPDDVELLCAGTLALLAAQGHVVLLAHMTYGDKGGRQDPRELADTRAREATASAALIGASTVGRICGDLELYDTDEHLARVAEIIADADCDVVLTHRPDDYHTDHRVTGELVLSVTDDADAPPVWFMDTIGGVAFRPTHYVDVSSVIDVKKRMIRCHESQMSWMSAARHTDMEYMIEWTGRWRGLQCGAGYAEGFAPARESRPAWFAADLDARSLVAPV